MSRAGRRWTFFLKWMRNPLRMAAVAPSGRDLTDAMLAQLPPGSRRVIELGGGTGVFTEQLVASVGIAPRDLLVLELDDALHALLRARFPGAQVVHGNARDLVALADSCGYLRDGPADAVISGLGLLTMDGMAQEAILRAAFDCLRPDGVFIQFTYGPAAPVEEGVCTRLGLRMERGDFVLRNVPPATVYTYRRV